MKKIIQTLFFACLLLTATTAVHAQTITDNGSGIAYDPVSGDDGGRAITTRSYSSGVFTIACSGGDLQTKIEADLSAPPFSQSSPYNYSVVTNLVITGTILGSDYDFIRDRLTSLTTLVVNPPTPVITINTQPAPTTTVTAGIITGRLSVTARVTLGATLSYQWYENTTNSNTGGTVISGATGIRFTIPTTLTAGTYYYYCVVSATGGATPVASNVATVTVTIAPIYVVTVGANRVGNVGIFDGGTVTTDKRFATAGETVTLVISPRTGNGYEPDEIRVYYTGSSDTTSTVPLYGTGNTRTFTMPAHNVTVMAVFKQKGWTVAKSLIENARFAVSQEKDNTAEALRYWLADTVNRLIQAADFVVSPYDIVVYRFSPAVAGDAVNPSGTDGLFEFRASPPNFSTSAYSSGVIAATLYDPVGTEVIEGAHTGAPLRTWTQGGVLHVGGLTQGEMLYIYNMYGQLIYQATAVGDEVKIVLPARGMYVIQTACRAVKIMF